MAKVFKVMLCGALPSKSHLKERHMLVLGTVELIKDRFCACLFGGPLLKDVQKTRYKVVNTRRPLVNFGLSKSWVSNPVTGGTPSCRVQLQPAPKHLPMSFQ